MGGEGQLEQHVLGGEDQLKQHVLWGEDQLEQHVVGGEDQLEQHVVGGEEQHVEKVMLVWVGWLGKGHLVYKLWQLVQGRFDQLKQLREWTRVDMTELEQLHLMINLFLQLVQLNQLILLKLLLEL